MLRTEGTALFLPTQPGGGGVASITRSRGICFARSARTCAVPSDDWSFTAMICVISGCATSDSMHAAITASSLRAGTMAVTVVSAEPEWVIFIRRLQVEPALVLCGERFDSLADRLV